MEPLHFAVGVGPPVGRPYTKQAPAELFENLLTQPVAVSCRGGAVVSGTITLDASKKFSFCIGVDHTEVDTEVGDADLGMDLPAAHPQPFGNRFFEAALEIAACGSSYDGEDALSALFGKHEDLFEVLDTLRDGAGEIDMISARGSKDEELFPCAGYCHIEPPCAAGLVEWPEIHRDLSRHIGPIREGQDDDVPLLTLNILEVFHQYGFETLIREKTFESRTLLELCIE